MIINLSRISTFQQCRRKAQLLFDQRHAALSTAQPLLWGGAIHKGFASFFAKRDIEAACTSIEQEWAERTKDELILPEERPLINHSIRQTKEALRAFARHYSNESYTVLAPEVEFCVPVPDTEHFCWYFYKVLNPRATPNDFLQLESTQHCTTGPLVEDELMQRAWQPIFLKGRSDAIIQWNRLIWLLEHKSTSLVTQNYYKQWEIDFQPTGYIWGINQAIGLRPHGFLLNTIRKPNKRAADQFNFGFEREPFIKTDEDLADFVHDFTLIAQDYEHAIIHNRMYKSPKSCIDYNRTCMFHAACTGHREPIPGETITRPIDYVEKEYYTILKMEVPPDVSLSQTPQYEDGETYTESSPS